MHCQWTWTMDTFSASRPNELRKKLTTNTERQLWKGVDGFRVSLSLNMIFSLSLNMISQKKKRKYWQYAVKHVTRIEERTQQGKITCCCNTSFSFVHCSIPLFSALANPGPRNKQSRPLLLASNCPFFPCKFNTNSFFHSHRSDPPEHNTNPWPPYNWSSRWGIKHDTRRQNSTVGWQSSGCRLSPMCRFLFYVS